MDSGGLEPLPVTSHKHDPAWKHCQMFKIGDKVQLKCIYCGKLFKGGGIHRMKEHLAGHRGNASTCQHTPPEVSLLMQQSLDGVLVKKRKKQKIVVNMGIINNPPSCETGTFDNDGDVSIPIDMITVPSALAPSPSLLVDQGESSSKKVVERRKRGRPRNSHSTPPTPVLGVDDTLIISSQRISNPAHEAIGRFLFDVGIPLDAVNSFYFQAMIDAIASQGSGVVAPSSHDLRGWILINSFDEVKSNNDNYRATWGRTGCSIMVDQWSTEKGTTLISFLVYSPEGTMFLKSADVTHVISSPDGLSDLLKDVVEEVGVKNVLQVITNGEEHYVAARKRLAEYFPNLYWTSCSSRLIELILEEFAKLEWILEALEQAKCITRFVYNHSVVLSLLRRHTFGHDLVVPGVNPIHTSFLSLKRMVDLKRTLHSMVTSQEWLDSPYSKKTGGLAMQELIISDAFWNSCILIVNLMDPMLRLLRIVSSERRPAMGYVYAGMYRTKETIKRELPKKEDYLVYWNIIDRWWDHQWQFALHAAGFFLNPKFFFSVEGDILSEIQSGLIDCIERLVPESSVQDKIMKELNAYKNAAGDFGRKMAIRARDSLLPAEWWSTYGGGCPNLARLAIRILSQTCSSSGCKRDQIPFEELHNTVNNIEHQRLSDLVFVQYNLRLGQIRKCKDALTDPISFESISNLEDWVTQRDMSLDEYEDPDWKSIGQPSGNTVLLGPSTDDTEDLGTGFDDIEILERVKDVEGSLEETSLTDKRASGVGVVSLRALQ